MYEGENNSTANANSCFLKAAHFYAQIDEFEKGAELFEKIAAASADTKLLEFSLREYLIKASFCRMAMNDQVGLKRALDKYAQQYFKWNNSTEQRFVTVR
jgi:alpha-soluble NSF attachment protein